MPKLLQGRPIQADVFDPGGVGPPIQPSRAIPGAQEILANVPAPRPPIPAGIEKRTIGRTASPLGTALSDFLTEFGGRIGGQPGAAAQQRQRRLGQIQQAQSQATQTGLQQRGLQQQEFQNQATTRRLGFEEERLGIQRTSAEAREAASIASAARNRFKFQVINGKTVLVDTNKLATGNLAGAITELKIGKLPPEELDTLIGGVQEDLARFGQPELEPEDVISLSSSDTKDDFKKTLRGLLKQRASDVRRERGEERRDVRLGRRLEGLGERQQAGFQFKRELEDIRQSNRIDLASTRFKNDLTKINKQAAIRQKEFEKRRQTLPDNVNKAISAIDASIVRLTALGEDALKPENAALIGTILGSPLISLRRGIGRTTGFLLNGDQFEFLSDTSQSFLEARKEFAGSAVTPTELVEILKGYPNENMANFEQFVRAVVSSIKILQQKREQLITGFVQRRSLTNGNEPAASDDAVDALIERHKPQ